MNEFVKILLSALLGGSGLCGIVFLFIRYYIEKRLKERDARDKLEDETRKRRRQANDKIQHATGRTLFWVVKAIETGEHNGDLKKSFEDLQNAEEEAKDIDREILARYDDP